MHVQYLAHKHYHEACLISYYCVEVCTTLSLEIMQWRFMAWGSMKSTQ